MTVEPLPDDFLPAARAGDRDALERLLRAEQPRIHTVCRRITGNDADALDATQEALIKIVRGLPRFDGRSRFSTWAHRIAVNAALDELRRRDRRPLVGLPEHPDGEPIDPPGPDPDLDTTVADRLLLETALADLPDEFRLPVVLRDVARLEYREIAAVLDLPIGTVRSRISRGRGRLADRISGNRTRSDERPTH